MRSSGFGREVLQQRLTAGLLVVSGLLGTLATAGCEPGLAQVPEPAPSCEQLDQVETQRRMDQIAKSVRSNNSNPEEQQRTDASLLAKYNVHRPDTADIERQVDTAATVEEAVAATNVFTTKTYEFSTRAIIDSANPKQTRDDLKQLIFMLGLHPVERTRLERASQYILGSPEPGQTQASTTEKAGALSAPDPQKPGRFIFKFGPGHVWLRDHEGGHAIHDLYLSRACGNSEAHDPSFTMHNPTGFAYQDPPMKWEGITTREYAATDKEEDAADIYRILIFPGSGCEPARHSAIAGKMAVLTMHLDALQPRAGQYSLDAFANNCSTAG